MAILRSTSQPLVTTPAKPSDLELADYALRIRPLAAGERLWERVLTEDDRLALGGDFLTAFGKYRTAGMWAKLRGVSRERATVDVAHALGLMDGATHQWLLRELGQLPNDSEQAIEDAIQTGVLVLVERPRAAYWNGTAIQAEWDKRDRVWDFFWELCRCGKARQPLDWDQFQTKDYQFVTKQKSRLTCLPKFPADLAEYIVPAGRGAQRLDLPPSAIRLFEQVAPDQYRERTA